MSFRYDGCIAVAKVNCGIIALFEKKSTLVYFARLNLKATDER